MLNPCARESKVRTGRFLKEKLIPDHGLFSSYEGQQGAAKGQNSWSFFMDAHGFERLGCWLARRLHQLKAFTTTMNLGISFSLLLYHVGP